MLLLIFLTLRCFFSGFYAAHCCYGLSRNWRWNTYEVAKNQFEIFGQFWEGPNRVSQTSPRGLWRRCDVSASSLRMAQTLQE